MFFDINPYSRQHGFWCFDDKDRGLVAEEFVGGAEDILTVIAKGRRKLKLRFSDNYQEMLSPDVQCTAYTLTLVEKPLADNMFSQQEGWSLYYCEQLGMDGWLCPSLFLFFDERPQKIYFAERS